jgi:hypothetical protein
MRVKAVLLAAVLGFGVVELALADQQAAKHSRIAQEQNIRLKLQAQQHLLNNHNQNIAQMQKLHTAAKLKSAAIPHAAQAHRTAVLNAAHQELMAENAANASYRAGIVQQQQLRVSTTSAAHWNSVQNSNRAAQAALVAQRQAAMAVDGVAITAAELGNETAVDGSDRFLPPLPQGFSNVEPGEPVAIAEVPIRQPLPLHSAPAMSHGEDRDFSVLPAPSAITTVEPGTPSDTDDSLFDGFDREWSTRLQHQRSIHPRPALRHKPIDPYGGGEYPVSR